MYQIDFEYAGRRLSEFGCIVCYINTSAGIRETDIGCDIKFTTVKNNHSSIHSATSSVYENVYTTTFDIMKNVCDGNVDDIYMTLDESRAITKWLNRRGYNKFKFYNPGNNIDSVNYYGSFNVKPIVFNEKIIGMTLTFTSNAPYGFGDKNESVYYMLDTTDTFSVFGDGDEINTIYPNVKVTCYEDGELKITNTKTGTCVEIRNCVNGETISMDGEHRLITTDNNEHVKTLFNDFEYEFLDIETDDSDGCENIYTVSMPCKIAISYSPIRKVGVQ